MLKITFSKSRGLENKLGHVIKINSNVGSISAALLQRLNDESRAAAAQSLASSQQSAQSAIDAQNSAEEAAGWADVAGANFQGMNAAQFNAIRAQNNEDFAASGFVHFGKYEIDKQVNETKPGLYTALTTPNTLLMGKEAGTGSSKTDEAIINVAGILTHLLPDFKIKFPEAPDGRTTYNKSTGAVTTYDHAYQAFAAAEADPTNIEVVTDRVDMWGFETWLEEVSAANPYIYPNGLIQSQATTMDGITTSASNRPVSYYAVFDGDTGSKGTGVNFFELTTAQKRKVLANHKNNLFFGEDGKLYQWRLRQRTIAGAGNGDWLVIDSASKNSTAGSYLRFSDKTKVGAQGVLDAVKVASGGAIHYVSSISNYNINNVKDDPAIFYARDVEGPFSANGECYFLVCGTVSRLNQGAYHPSLNPNGARAWRDGNGTTLNTTKNWHEIVQTECIPTNTAQAFNVLGTGIPQQPGASSSSGFIGQLTGKTRPDGRYYDAIYADGQGGVCRDMRYSAYGVDSVDFAETDQKVKNGTYRGFEKLVFTSNFIPQTVVSNASGSICKISQADLKGDTSWISLSSTPSVAQGHIIVDGEILKINSVRFNASDGNTWWIYTDKPRSYVGGETVIGCFGYYLPTSIGGSFLQTDVIGDPANILQVDALKNGWEGSWIPDLTSTTVAVTRKALGNVVGNRLTTLDGGSTWAASSGISIEPVNNNIYRGYSAGAQGVTIFSYQAFAKQTESANNIEVYGGESGVGVVWASNRSSTFDGALFCETLIGIPKSVHGDTTQIRHAIKYFKIDSNKLIVTSQVKHNPLFDGNGINANDSIAVKALDYNVNINQQGFKQYAATELKHDGTDWGDDSKIHIVNGKSTMTDLNGNTVKVVTHKLKEPLGWIKNKV